MTGEGLEKFDLCLGEGIPLETLSGLTRSSIANIESGKQRVLLHQLLRFAETLRVDVGELVPPVLEVPQLLSTETAHEMDDYGEKLLRMVSAGATARITDGNKKA